MPGAFPRQTPRSGEAPAAAPAPRPSASAPPARRSSGCCSTRRPAARRFPSPAWSRAQTAGAACEAGRAGDAAEGWGTSLVWTATGGGERREPARGQSQRCQPQRSPQPRTHACQRAPGTGQGPCWHLRGTGQSLLGQRGAAGELVSEALTWGHLSLLVPQRWPVPGAQCPPPRSCFSIPRCIRARDGNTPRGRGVWLRGGLASTAGPSTP